MFKIKKKGKTPIVMSLFFAMAEKVFEMLVGFITGMIVIRCLKIEDYAVISSISAYSTFIGFLNVAPENYLFKGFASFKKEEVTEYAYSYIIFDLLNGCILLGIYFVIGIILYNRFGHIGYIIIALQNGISLLLRQIYNVSRIILELNYLQRKITAITIFVRTCTLIMTLLLLLNKSLLFYAIISTISCAMEVLLTYVGCKKILVIKHGNHYNWLSIVYNSFKEYALVNHFSGVLTSIIYASDTMFLGWFCDMRTVGLYGIALTCINYTIAFIQILQKQTSIALGNSKTKERDIEIVNKFVAISVGISALMIIGFLILGKAVLKIYTGYQDEMALNELYRYSLNILIGVSTFNCVRPITSFINLRCNLMRYLLGVLTPVLVLTLISYYISSKYWGGLGIAYSNIFVYSVWAVIVIGIYIVKIKKYND